MIFIIKVCRWLYINPLTILLFVFCYINRKLEILTITYIIMILHEMAHLISARCIGLMPSYISIQPFGVNLRLKNQIVNSLSDEIIVYLSGPFVNAVFALGTTILNQTMKNPYLDDFAIKNLALFIMNLMPIVPLDGGIIIKKILMHKIGYKSAAKIMKLISAVLIFALLVLSIYLIYKSQFNFSVLFLAIFLIANIFTEKEKYNIDFIKELMYYKEKCISYNNKKVKCIISTKNEKIRTIAERFTNGSFFMIFVLDKNGKVDDIVTEKELIDKLVRDGASAYVG